MHIFENGDMISENIIVFELNRTKGKVTREETFDLARVANRIRKQRDDLIEAIIEGDALKTYDLISKIKQGDKFDVG